MTILEAQMGRRIKLNRDWKFCWVEDGKALSDGISDAYKVNYNDSAWRKLDLPHDWSIEFDFNIENSLVGSEAGYLDGGIGWYRKALILPKTAAGKRVAIHFGGVYMDSTVYVNGQQVGKYPNGYMPFTYDLTDYIVADGVTENIIVVKAVNQQPSSRWYSGSGIYRDVELIITDPIHVVEYGTFITTPDIETEYKTGKVTAHVTTEIKNESGCDQKVKVRVALLNYEDDSVVTTGAETETLSILAGEVYHAQQCIVVKNPKLWSNTTPHLYKMRTEVLVENEVVDTYETRCGFRWFKFDANEGFSLNGEWMKLKGVCMHHDQGALGAVANARAIERQMEIMQEMGTNAIRVTHNPASDDLLRICDEKGLLVIDEAFDTWYGGKKQYDLGRFFAQGSSSHPEGASTITWAEFDLKRMVKRGRNFPAIIAWSVGNEVGEAHGDERSIETIKNMKKWVEEVDPTRGITQGMDKFRFGTGEGGHEDIAAVQDTVGFNYAEGNYDRIHEKHPEWALYGSETSSATKSRGVYSHPDKVGSHDSAEHPDYQQSSYDNDHVAWGKTASDSWIEDRDRKYIAGQFIWTGFDYIGEPTPWHNTGGPGHSKSPKSSYFGIVDTAGFPKDDYYLYQSVWKSASESPMVHILPHWNWEDHNLRSNVTGEDGKIPLRVYSNAPHVELFIDGISQGVKSFAQMVTNYGAAYQQQSETSDRLYLEWRLDYTYAPGTEIKAVAKDAKGEVVAQECIVTAGKAAKISLEADRNVIHADGMDLCYITVDITDAQGHFVPTADNEVKFDIVGNGKIVGVDNGNPISHERYKSQADGTWKRKAFNGKALVIVQGTQEGGSFTLKASSEGLQGEYITVYTKENTLKDSHKVLGYKKSLVITEVGVEPVLPQFIEATLADGTQVNQEVKWTKPSAEQLGKMGVVTLNGVVSETNAGVELELVVAQSIKPSHVAERSEKSSVAQLTDLIINDKKLEGFDSHTYTYTVKVPYGEKVHNILANTDPEAYAAFCIIPPHTHSRAALIEVTAEDGVSTANYIVHIEEAMPMLHKVLLKIENQSAKEDDKVPFTLESIKEDGTMIDLEKASINYLVASNNGGHVELVQEEIYAYTAGTVSIAAEVTYEGVTMTSNEVTLTILPNEVIKTIESYEVIHIVSTVGICPSLPKTIKAHFNVGFSRMVEVVWNEIASEQYSTYGQFEVQGKVAGQSLAAKAMITIKGVIATQSVSVATVKGIPARLPEKVMVHYSDGTKEEKNASWDEAAVDYSAPGQVNVAGTLEGLLVEIKASVRIIDKVDEIKVSENYAKQWTGSEFPAALASFTNDGEGSRDRIEHINDTIISFDEVQHNRWSNWQSTAREKEWVGILFAEGGNITRRYIDTVNVGFFEDHETSSPKNFTIEYYVGDFEPTIQGHFGHVTEGDLAKEENWKPVANISASTESVETGSMKAFSFDLVHTYAIRLNMTKKDEMKGIAITEIEAYGKEAIAYESYEVKEILVDGNNIINEFDETLNYTYTTKGDQVPSVEVEATRHASVTVISAIDRHGVTKIEVVPENGDVTKTKIYHIWFR